MRLWNVETQGLMTGVVSPPPGTGEPVGTHTVSQTFLILLHGVEAGHVSKLGRSIVIQHHSCYRLQAQESGEQPWIRDSYGFHSTLRLRAGEVLGVGRVLVSWSEEEGGADCESLVGPLATRLPYWEHRATVIPPLTFDWSRLPICIKECLV